MNDNGPLFLERCQKETPEDLIIAHDLGLAYYWQAKHAGTTPATIPHWKRVIANWSLILESNDYWESWKTQRADVYRTKITDDDTHYVRNQLHDQLKIEIPGVVEDKGQTHLQARYFLERRAIRLLKKTAGFQLATGPLYAGPLFVEQIDGLAVLASFFEDLPVYLADSLQTMLAYASPENRDVGDSARALRIAFSDLGIVDVHVGFGDVTSAHEYIAQLKCPFCAPVIDDIPDQIADYVLTPCDPDCTWFAAVHPSYAAIPGGAELYFKDAVEMLGGSYILRASQSLRGTYANVSGFASNLTAFQACGWLLRIDEQRLIQQLVDFVEESLNYLESKDDFDSAIALLDAVQPALNVNGTLDAAKARLLNVRGVEAGNNERWEQAVNDLRAAYQLNPLPRYQENLRIALRMYSNQASEQGWYALADELRDEAIKLAREAEEGTPDQVSAQVRTRPDTPPTPVVEVPEKFKLTESERYNPVLFDEQGILCLAAAFTSNGRAVIERALAEAIAAQSMLIGVPELVLGLLEGPQTRQFFAAHHLATQPLRQAAEDALKPAAPELALTEHSILSQANFRPGVLKILDQAWELAQYTWGFVDEDHLLYSLLLSDARLLYEARIDARALVAAETAPVHSILRGA